MEITTDSVQGWQVIRLAGHVDSKTVNILKDYIEAEIRGAQPVALELTDVSFMSSAGLRTLLTLHRKTESLNVSLALVGLQELIAETMKVTGFYDYFVIYTSTSELPTQGQ